MSHTLGPRAWGLSSPRNTLRINRHSDNRQTLHIITSSRGFGKGQGPILCAMPGGRSTSPEPLEAPDNMGNGNPISYILSYSVCCVYVCMCVCIVYCVFPPPASSSRRQRAMPPRGFADRMGKDDEDKEGREERLYNRPLQSAKRTAMLHAPCRRPTLRRARSTHHRAQAHRAALRAHITEIAHITPEELVYKAL